LGSRGGFETASQGGYMTRLNTGDKAPGFNLIDQNGEKVKLADFKSKKLFIFFYPKAGTSG